MFNRISAAILAAAGVVAGIAHAGPPVLELPIPCRQGEDCWLFRYVDLDPSGAVADFRCGRLSDDGHKGTDFAIADVHAMARGVPVFAMAAGTVLGTRDGMADRDVLIAGHATVRGRECGNGAVIDHGDGWETQYCHLRKGSVAVKTGDVVATGQRIGLVGYSGAATFPHVHVTLRHNQHLVDPFTGLKVGDADAIACAGKRTNGLWSAAASEQLTYTTPVVYAAGFATGPVTSTEIRLGKHRTRQFPPTVPALTFWSYTTGLTPDLTLELGFKRPGRDRFLTREFRFEAEETGHQTIVMRSVTLDGKGKKWPPGLYQARLRVLSDKREVIQEQVEDLLID